VEKKIIALLLAILTLALTTSVLAYTLLNQNREESKETQTRTFIFEFPPNTQKIINGTLAINITFTIKGDRLRAIAYINDTLYISHKLLCLTFDSNNDTQVDAYDSAMIMYADNFTQRSAIVPGGPVLLPMTLPQQSECHVCVFDGTQHIYNATYLLTEVNHDLVQMNYQLDEYICIRFHFGLEW